MNVAHVATVARKEIADNLRDRRSLLSAFSIAVLMPALFIGMLLFIINQAVGGAASRVEAHVVGAANAPALIDWLRSNSVELTEVELDDPRAAVRDGDLKLVLVIPDDFAAGFNAGQGHVQLIHDSSKLGDSARHHAQLSAYLNAYGRMIGRLRLQLRGVDPRIVDAIDTYSIDTATPAARALGVLATFPYLLALVIFMGGFYLAVDTTAGERDHGQLEPLLSLPVERRDLVLGKLLAVATFSVLALAAFLLTFAIALPFVPLHRIGMNLTLGPAKALGVLITCIPLSLLAAGMLMVVASFAKSFKEAQTYLSFVIFIPTLPLIVTSLMGTDPSLVTMFVPSLSQALLTSELLSGAATPALWIVVSVVTTLCVALLFFALAVRLYRSERLLV
ncbi:MAG: ABC transporter permease [Pseudomonadota bacterium]